MQCGACAMCRRGLPTHCLKRTVLGILNHDGVFAEFVRLPVKNLHRVVPEYSLLMSGGWYLPNRLASPRFQVLKQVEIPPESRVMVLGDGRLGQLVTQVLARKTGGLTLVGRHREKLELAVKLCGGKIRAALAEDVRPAHDQDIVIDCTGRVEGFEAESSSATCAAAGNIDA